MKGQVHCSVSERNLKIFGIRWLKIHQIRTTAPYTILIFKVLKSRITQKKEKRFFKGETIFSQL